MPIIGPGIAVAAGSRALGLRNDPYGSCNFHVEIQGVIAGGFSEVSGLTVETDIETIEEGGANNVQCDLIDRLYKLLALRIAGAKERRGQA